MITIAAGIRDIPRRCACDWDAPDYLKTPGRRWWTLKRPDPSCVLHGKKHGGGR